MMMKRFLTSTGLLVASFAPVSAQGAKPEMPPAVQKEAVAGALLTNDEKLALAKRVLFDEEPFLQSFQAQYSQTLNLFFRNEDYQTLRGNPFVGYSAVLGFRWPKDTKEVAFLGVGARAQALGLTPGAWSTAFRAAAKARGLTLNPKAAVKFEAGLVSLTEDLQQNLFGLVLEARITGPGGEFLYRFQFAKPRLGDAMTGSLDWILGYAMALGDKQGAQALAERLKAANKQKG